MKKLINAGKILTGTYRSCLIMLLSVVSAAVGVAAAPFDVIQTSGSEIRLEGSNLGGTIEGHRLTPGVRLLIVDYNNKEVAVVEVVRIDHPGGREEIVTRRVSGNHDIRVGFRAKWRPEVVGALFVDFSLLALNQTDNGSYAVTTGRSSHSAIDYGSSLTLGVFAVSGGRLPMYGYVATAYDDLGEIKFWDIIEIGALLRPAIKREVLYVSVGGAAGLAASFNTLKWARPDSVYQDDIGRNEGEAKMQWGGHGATMTYRMWAAASVNFSSDFGVQFKAGYFGYINKGFVDNATPSDADQDQWKIRPEWLEMDMGNGGFSAGISLLVNLSNAKLGSHNL